MKIDKKTIKIRRKDGEWTVTYSFLTAYGQHTNEVEFGCATLWSALKFAREIRKLAKEQQCRTK